MRIKRAPLLGGIVCILISIILLTTINISSCSTKENEDLNESITPQENIITYAYDITPEEREMLARLIFLTIQTFCIGF